MRADLADVPAALRWGAGAPLPGARGRGAVLVLTLPRGERAVVRTYRRGGVFAAVLRERFFDGARARREVDALRVLPAAHVSVVEPLAALARRAGFCWQLRLATALVDGAEPLPAFVAHQPALHRATVRVAGEAVARAFAAGLRHRDLHPDNLIARSRRPASHACCCSTSTARAWAPRSTRERATSAARLVPTALPSVCHNSRPYARGSLRPWPGSRRCRRRMARAR